ncbi:MAG: hypothetical protein V3V16_05735 [Melioribacteraceae bacterium]
MKIIIYILFITAILFCNVSAQDSLSGKYFVKTSKVYVNHSKPRITKNNYSREFKFNSILTKTNEVLSPSLQLGSLRKDDTFINSTWFYVLVGTAVTLGATASILKNEANNFDELYNKKGTHNNLDSRNKYDLYGGIALGALEVNVGFLIYKFLTD